MTKTISTALSQVIDEWTHFPGLYGVIITNHTCTNPAYSSLQSPYQSPVVPGEGRTNDEKILADRKNVINQ